MEGHLQKSISIDVGDGCLLEDSHGIFSHNSDQLIFGNEFESPMKGKCDCTCCMQLGPP